MHGVVLPSEQNQLSTAELNARLCPPGFAPSPVLSPTGFGEGVEEGAKVSVASCNHTSRARAQANPQEPDQGTARRSSLHLHC